MTLNVHSGPCKNSHSYRVLFYLEVRLRKFNDVDPKELLLRSSMKPMNSDMELIMDYAITNDINPFDLLDLIIQNGIKSLYK